MLKRTLTAFGLIAAHAVADGDITVIDRDSPDFLLGKQTRVNMKFIPGDAPDMWFKAGIRVQGTLESKHTDYKNPAKKDTSIQDAYLRRVRLEVGAGFGKHTSFVMDIRNDKSNYGIENTEGSFNVGDAYLKIKKPFDSSLVNFKFYRAKIDVSRTETVKSAYVIAYDRPYVADAAAQYISFNRRGTNAQMYGNWKNKVHYQVAVGSASSPEKIIDAYGKKGTDYVDLKDQSFFYGGKVRFSPFDGWEEKKRTETYFAQGKHAGIGVAYWTVPTLKGSTNYRAGSTGYTNTFDLRRELVNIEASAHYKGFFIQGEWFRFKDVVADWTPGNNEALKTGDSTGWYVTGEYVIKQLSYIAPYARYERWNRFDSKDGYEITSVLAGINWYLRGNSTKVGLQYQKDSYGENTGDKDVTYMRITSQFFF